MFSIKTNPQGKHHLYLNEKVLKVPVEEQDGSFELDDFAEISLEEIADEKVSELPNHFNLQFALDKYYAKVFNMFTITRKDNKVKLRTATMLDNSESEKDLDWLLWNPEKFNDIATQIGKNRKHKVKDNEELVFEFCYTAEGTIGDIFSKAIPEVESIFQETNLELYKQAVKQFG